MNKELTKEEAEEYYNKLWLENKELIQENIGKTNTERFELELELVDKNKEIERLNNIIKEAINYIDDNTYYKDHKGHINIDDLYLILQKGSEYVMNNEIKVMNNDEIRDFCIKKDLKIFELEQELKQKENIIKEVRDNLENSIKSINEKLKNNKEPFEVIDGKIQYINDYRVVRLKAFRTKCKELLEILDKENI